MNLVLTSARILALAFLLLAFAGCHGQKKVVHVEDSGSERQSCSVPQTLLLAEAFEDSRQTLSDPDCFHHFNNHFHALLDIALQDPKTDNEDKFHDYLLWVRDKGIISSNTAREYWRSYFTTTFTSLPDDYRISDYCSRKEDILNDMQDELEKKKQGFAAIRDTKGEDSSGPPKQYLKALNKFDKIELVFTAACKASEME